MSTKNNGAGPLNDIDDYIASAMREWEVPGLAVGIVKDDTTIMAKGFGVRKLGSTAQVDANTVFAIGSCTKAFTSAALGILVDEGKISWDDRVIRHLPSFRLYDPYVTAEITIRDLLCHRSGLPRCDGLWQASTSDREDILSRLRFVRQNTAFRSQWGYSNIMYTVAGHTIPAVTGTSWDQFIKERIFAPLGMTSSTPSIRELRQDGNVATPHCRLEERVQTIPWKDLHQIGPAGSVNSSATDMIQWMRLQLNSGVHQGRRLLSTKAMDEMRTPQSVLHPEGMGPEGRGLKLWHPGSQLMVYGLGWVLREYGNRVLVQHGGSVAGMLAMVTLVPGENLGVVVLTNGDWHFAQTALSQRIVDSCLGNPPRDWCSEFLRVSRGTQQQAKEGEERLQSGRVRGTHPTLELGQYTGVFSVKQNSRLSPLKVPGKNRGKFPGFTVRSFD